MLICLLVRGTLQQLALGYLRLSLRIGHMHDTHRSSALPSDEVRAVAKEIKDLSQALAGLRAESPSLILATEVQSMEQSVQDLISLLDPSSIGPHECAPFTECKTSDSIESEPQHYPNSLSETVALPSYITNSPLSPSSYLLESPALLAPPLLPLPSTPPNFGRPLDPLPFDCSNVQLVAPVAPVLLLLDIGDLNLQSLIQHLIGFKALFAAALYSANALPPHQLGIKAEAIFSSLSQLPTLVDLANTSNLAASHPAVICTQQLSQTTVQPAVLRHAWNILHPFVSSQLLETIIVFHSSITYFCSSYFLQLFSTYVRDWHSKSLETCSGIRTANIVAHYFTQKSPRIEFTKYSGYIVRDQNNEICEFTQILVMALARAVLTQNYVSPVPNYVGPYFLAYHEPRMQWMIPSLVMMTRS